MTSHPSSTIVGDIFTRTFVISDDVSFIFNRKPSGVRYIICIPAGGVNKRPLFISVEEFVKIIDITGAWVKDKCVSSDTSTRCKISSGGDSLRGSNRIDAVFSSRDNICLLYTSPSPRDS